MIGRDHQDPPEANEMKCERCGCVGEFWPLGLCVWCKVEEEEERAAREEEDRDDV